jgi:hypothetical protein
MIARTLVALLLAAGVALAAWGCTSSSSSSIPIPVISNVNGTTTAVTAVGAPIVINGLNFGGNPGTVTFTEGSRVESVAGGAIPFWTNTSIRLTVPAGLATPGSAAITVVTTGALTSPPFAISLVTSQTFNPADVTWTATTPLPGPLRGHASVAVLGSSSYLYAIGGNDGTLDVASVVFAPIGLDGSVGQWAQTSPLPATRAFLAAAEADATNSPLPVGQAFIYAIGGQTNATDVPGGNSTVYTGNVNLETGQVIWTEAGIALPEARMGAKAVIAGGFLHVTGGFATTGLPIAMTASAPINADGTIGAFTENAPTSNLPVPVGFHESFAQGDFLYVLGGNRSATTNPFSPSIGTASGLTYFAPVQQGVVGAWSPTSSLVTQREKFVLFASAGQVLVYEGAHGGGTTLEGESASVNADGTLGVFSALPASALPGLNVFNTAGATSPLVTNAGAPRFVILGGDSLTAPGTLSAAVSDGGPTAGD